MDTASHKRRTRVVPVVPGPEWREALKQEVPREEIPAFLSDLQAIVARMRGFRDNLTVPAPEDLHALVTPVLRRHRAMAVAYIDDPVYREVLDAALAPA